MKRKFVVGGWWLGRTGSCDGLPDPVKGTIPSLRMPRNINTVPLGKLLFAKVVITGKEMALKIPFLPTLWYLLMYLGRNDLVLDLGMTLVFPTFFDIKAINADSPLV